MQPASILNAYSQANNHESQANRNEYNAGGQNGGLQRRTAIKVWGVTIRIDGQRCFGRIGPHCDGIAVSLNDLLRKLSGLPGS